MISSHAAPAGGTVDHGYEGQMRGEGGVENGRRREGEGAGAEDKVSGVGS